MYQENPTLSLWNPINKSSNTITITIIQNIPKNKYSTTYLFFV